MGEHELVEKNGVNVLKKNLNCLHYHRSQLHAGIEYTNGTIGGKIGGRPKIIDSFGFIEKRFEKSAQTRRCTTCQRAHSG